MIQVPYTKQKYSTAMLPMLGLNLSNNFEDGELSASKNVSSRAYPYLTTRRAREKQSKDGGYYSGAVAMAATDKLVVAEASTQGGVSGYQIYYDGNACTNGFVTVKPKHFVPINTQICIFPNKKYFSVTDNNLTLHDMEATVSCPHVYFTDNQTFRTTTNLDVFTVGDSINMTGTGAGAGKSYVCVVEKIYTDTIDGTLYYIVKANMLNIFSDVNGEDIPFTLERKVPDMAYVCCSNNRLYGCSSDGGYIYASGLGLPCTWNDYSGLSTDSYAVAVATPSPFTGCIALGSSVLFFKEKNLHKLTGSYPAEYYLYQYEFEGLRQGCEKSMSIINEVLYYVGIHGVYRYTGGTPQLISSKLGEVDITEAVAGNDGDTYYLSAKVDNVQKIICYETRYGLWQQEDDLKVVDFARIGRNLYFLDTSGFVWNEDNNTIDSSIEWYAQFCPFYETIKGKKVYSKVIIRLNVTKGAYVKVKARYDNSKWYDVKTIPGDAEGAIGIAVKPSRCDKFEIMLEGKGTCTIEQLCREYSVGSSR